MNQSFIARFIKGLVATSTGTFIEIAFGMLSLMIAARFISKEQFGSFVLIQVIASLFRVISDFGIEKSAVMKAITGEQTSRKILITNTAICYQLLISIVMCIVILLCSPFFQYILNFSKLKYLPVYILLFYLLSSANVFLNSILQGFHQYRHMAVSKILMGFVKLALVIFFVVYLKYGISGLIYAFLLSFIITIVYQFFAIPVKKHISFDKKIYKGILYFGFPLGLNSLVTLAFKNFDRIMIGAIIGPIAVANYDIASKLPASGTRMFESFISVFFPNMSELFAHNKHAEATKVLNNSLRLLSTGIMFSAFIAFLFQEDITRILFSDKYLESAPALSLLVVALSLFMVGTLLGTSLVSLGQSDKPVKINVVDVIINVIGNLTLIPIYGFMGAVYSTLLGHAVANLIYTFFSKKNGINVKTREYLKPFLIFVVCCLIFIKVGVEVFYGKLLLIFLFLILCWASSLITYTDLSNTIIGLKYRTEGNK